MRETIAVEGSAEVIGVVGLGNIGRPIATRLGERFPGGIVAYDKDESARAAMTRVGVPVASSIADLGARASRVLLVVRTDEDVRSACLGTSRRAGLFGAMNPGGVVVIASTVHPQTSRELNDIADDYSLAVVDAAVSGGALGAAAGTLCLMIGGRDAAVQRCSDIFDALSANTFHLGAVGTGQVAKLMNNLIAFAALNATKEAVQLAEALGLSSSKLLEVAACGTGDSWAVRNWAKHLQANEGHVSGGRKDLALIESLANEVGIEVPLAKALGPMCDNLYS